MQPFEKGSDIESWLKDQWAGIFQELLRQRKDNSRFSDLASQIRQLEAVNSTLKSYLESVLQTVSPDKSGELIEKENKSLSRAQALENIRRNPWFEHVHIVTDLSAEQVLDLHLMIDSVNDIPGVLSTYVPEPNAFVAVLEPLVEFEEARRDFARLREALKQRSVRFTKKSLDELDTEVRARKRDPRFSNDGLLEAFERVDPAEEDDSDRDLNEIEPQGTGTLSDKATLAADLKVPRPPIG